MIGTVLNGRWRLLRLIGEGGMGAVFEAEGPAGTGKRAIKLLHQEYAKEAVILARFLTEGQAGRAINHPNVAQVLDTGKAENGVPYLVMELLHGTPVASYVDAGQAIPLAQAVHVAHGVLQALAVAHGLNIVHRDIKPDNLFIATGAGGKSILKILDFGISKMSTRNVSTSGNELTEAGDKFGTPVYMSPEQLLSARDVDARADVWAMGVVLYELLTGKLPFDGDLPVLCSAILTKPHVPLATARPYLPEALEDVIGRCLEKDVEKRFQNVAELAQELRQFAGPVSQVRIDHVVQLIRGAGEAVRPATPSPQAIVRALRDEPTLADASPERSATTGSGMSAWGAAPARDFGRTRAGRVRLAAIALAGLVAVVLGVAAIAGGRGGHAPAAAATPAHPPTSIAAPEPAPVVTDPPRSAAPADPSVAPGASASVGVPAASAGPKAPRGAATARPRKAPTADPNAVINPFE
jgi:serine/threonine-protein kinase